MSARVEVEAKRMRLDGQPVDELTWIHEARRVGKLDELYDALRKRRDELPDGIAIEVSADAPTFFVLSTLRTTGWAAGGVKLWTLVDDSWLELEHYGDALDEPRRYLRVLHLYKLDGSGFLPLAWQIGGAQDEPCVRRVSDIDLDAYGPDTGGRRGGLSEALKQEIRFHGRPGVEPGRVAVHLPLGQPFASYAPLLRAVARTGLRIRVGVSLGRAHLPAAVSKPKCVPEVRVFGGPELIFPFDPHWAHYGMCVDDCEQSRRTKGDPAACGAECRGACRPLCTVGEDFCPAGCDDLPRTAPH